MPDKYCDIKIDYTKVSVLEDYNAVDIKYPVIVSVPHAGTFFPTEFLNMTSRTIEELRSNEDLYVSSLVEPLTKQGIPIVSMNVARAFIDVNRDKIELDAKMFYNYPKDKLIIENHRCRFGLGLIHRVDANNNLIYDGLLSYGEVQERIKNVYEIYHKRLNLMIGKCVKKFGMCMLIDCHSMPSKICNIIPLSDNIDFCIGNLFSQSCPEVMSSFVENSLKQKGYNVSLNVPYSGAFITFNYCQPRKKIYTLQLEVNRGLYAHESLLKKNDNFQQISNDICSVILNFSKKVLDF